MVDTTIRLLAGGQQLDLGWPYGIADSTVYIVIDETLASMDATLDDIMFPQTEDDCRSETAAFQRLNHSPFHGILLLWTASPLQSPVMLANRDAV
jgi:hypothetical protein